MQSWRFSYGGNEGARNNAEGAIKNNAEDAIKTAAHNRTPVAAGARIRVLQGSGRKAKLRFACLARGSFVDRAGRGMIEYRYNSSERHMEVFSILEG